MEKLRAQWSRFASANYRPCTRNEAGFTLIELLIVTVLIPIVIGAVTVVLITVFKDQSGVQNRLSDSHDAQITSAYFVRDVQGAQTIVNGTSPQYCGSALGPQILGLQWPSSAGTVNVSYVSISYPSSTSIVRVFCASGGLPSTIVHGLPPSTNPTVCLKLVSGSTSCTPRSQPGGTVSEVSITVPEKNGFSYSILAAPRFTSSTTGPSPGGQPPAPALILLGGGGSSCPLLTVNGGHGTLTVASGDESIAINSTCTNAISQSNQSNVFVGTIYTQASPPSLTQSCNNCSPSSYPTYYSATPTDPYSGFNSAPPTVTTPGLCLGGNSNMTCSAGLYSTSLGNCPTFSQNYSIQFAPGITEFNGCTLGGGSINGGTITAGNPNPGGGALLYFVNGASMQVGHSPTVTIYAMTSGSYCPADTRYPCISLWQAPGDSTPWAWGGGSQQGRITVYGALYLPSTGLTINNVQSILIQEAAVEYLVVSNAGTTTIG